MKALVRKAKAILDECDEVLDTMRSNWEGKWIDVRDLTNDFINNLPKEIIEVFELNQRALHNLEDSEFGEGW